MSSDENNEYTIPLIKYSAIISNLWSSMYLIDLVFVPGNLNSQTDFYQFKKNEKTIQLLTASLLDPPEFMLREINFDSRTDKNRKRTY